MTATSPWYDEMFYLTIFLTGQHSLPQPIRLGYETHPVIPHPDEVILISFDRRKYSEPYDLQMRLKVISVHKEYHFGRRGDKLTNHTNIRVYCELLDSVGELEKWLDINAREVMRAPL